MLACFKKRSVKTHEYIPIESSSDQYVSSDVFAEIYFSLQLLKYLLKMFFIFAETNFRTSKSLERAHDRSDGAEEQAYTSTQRRSALHDLPRAFRYAVRTIFTARYFLPVSNNNRIETTCTLLQVDVKRIDPQTPI